MFSELIDEVVTTSGRRDRRADIIRYANAALRESQNQAYFARDMLEDSLTPDAEPFIWTAPSNLRLLRTVMYPGIGTIDLKPPGRIQENLDYYYYRTDDSFAFKGAGDVDSVNIAYYRYLRRLTYYDVGSRPARLASLDDSDEPVWEYLLSGSYVSTLGSAALDLAARNLVTNWLLDRWNHTIVEGTICKLFLVVQDPRGPSEYTLYKTLQADIKKGETFESLDM